MEAQRGTPRVLIFSLRNIFGKALFRCPHFEFEDIICEIDSAELLAPKVDPSSARSQLRHATGVPRSDHSESGYSEEYQQSASTIFSLRSAVSRRI